MNDIFFMEKALEQAKVAASLGEVPIGAVFIWDGEIVAVAHNRRELDRLATAHAEILCITKACERLGGWRLHKGTLYVTLEPCPMCVGAIINARIARVVYGAKDPKAGCCESVLNLFEQPFNHCPEVLGGVLEEECGTLLSAFFGELREKRQRKKAASRIESNLE